MATSHTVAAARPARSLWRRLMLWAVVLAVALALAGLAGRWASEVAIDKLRVAGAQRLDGYAVSLENLLSKYDFLPGTLELNKDVIALLKRPADEMLRAEVNAYQIGRAHV